MLKLKLVLNGISEGGHMKLIICDIDKTITSNKLLVELFKSDFTIKMFYSEECDRKYDVYKVYNNSQTKILKKLTNPKEVLIHEYLLKHNFEFMPNHYGSFLNGNDTWVITSFHEEKTSSNNELVMLELIDHLSYLNGSLLCSKLSNSEIDIMKIWLKVDSDVLIDFSSELSEKELATIVESQKILDSCKRSVIHGDMIPLNIISSETGVKIIDWEHLSYSPYVLDISRLLGDYNKTIKWVDPKLEEHLLRRYFDNIEVNLNLNFEEFILDYHCGVLENYLRILLAHKRNKWKETAWYDLNLRALRSEIKFIQIYENKSV